MTSLTLTVVTYRTLSWVVTADLDGYLTLERVDPETGTHRTLYNVARGDVLPLRGEGSRGRVAA